MRKVVYSKSVWIVLFPGVLKQVIDKCVVGASVREICEFGDSLLTEETSKVFKKEKELKKGKLTIYLSVVLVCIVHSETTFFERGG